MPPSRKVSEIVALTLMPIRRAASGSWAVARIARPARVGLMNQVSANTSGIITAKARMYPRRMRYPADGEHRLLRVDQVGHALR